MRRNEEHLKKLESEKKREQHEGELGVVPWGGVNTKQAELDKTDQENICLHSYMQSVDSVCP